MLQRGKKLALLGQMKYMLSRQQEETPVTVDGKFFDWLLLIFWYKNSHQFRNAVASELS